MSMKRGAALLFAAGMTFATQAHSEDKFDLELEAIISSDGMDTGLTYTDHDPNFQITLTPSYGIFYGALFAENVDFGEDSPDGTIKASIGATPEFGDLSVDFNLQRRWRPGEIDKASTRWLPYVTATYTFSDQLSTDFGVGYYSYDKQDVTKSFWELFYAIDVTPVEGLALHAEASYDPNSDFDKSDTLEIIGSATLTLPKNFELVGKIGYEDYLQNQLPSYTWYEAQLNYNVNDHVALGLKAHANDLTSAECPDQAYTDCDNSIFATLKVKGSLSDLSK